MKKKFDLSSLNENNNIQLLVKNTNQEVKEIGKKIPNKKRGRPMESNEPRNEKVTVYFSSSEINNLNAIFSPINAE